MMRGKPGSTSRITRGAVRKLMRDKRDKRDKSGSWDEQCTRTGNSAASRWDLWTQGIDADFDSLVAVLSGFFPQWASRIHFKVITDGLMPVPFRRSLFSCRGL